MEDRGSRIEDRKATSSNAGSAILHPPSSILNPHVSPFPSAVRPTSVQPGGGWCMNLELVWGHCRRWLLRHIRPGYVRRMTEKRQGQCPNCPHDIIDPRDLKYWQNVCGFWFRPEDDSFTWRNHLGFARPGLAELFIFSAIFLGMGLLFAAATWIHGVFWIPAAAAGLVWLEILYFFRDPERQIPSDTSAVLSPADGTITDIGEVDAPGFPGDRAFRIGIFLSIFNVHVNRIPRSGRVIDVRYFPGAFLDARHPECPARNEQLWLDLEDAQTGRLIRIKQISGAVARRIVCWLKPDEKVQAGDRYGMIKFGSRTEVLIPMSDSPEVLVKVGDKVHGGASKLFRYQI
jgi:phosphatidylserine decarboxylase